MTKQCDSLAYPPRGMSRDEAGAILASAPRNSTRCCGRAHAAPKRVDSRVIWDRLKIEAAFSDLRDDEPTNPLFYLRERRPRRLRTFAYFNLSTVNMRQPRSRVSINAPQIGQLP
jgi:hypothetical protein